MRCLVFALDGLEYGLVVKWKLKHLLQRKYGKIEISEDYYYMSPHGEFVPYTPTIWASFLTGLPPSKHKVKSLWTYGRILDFIRRLPVISWIKNKRKILYKLGILEPKIVSKDTLNVKTIFDVVKPSIAVRMIAYNDDTEQWRKRSKAMLFEGLEKYEELVWEDHRLREKEFFNNLHKDWKLLMVYFRLADELGHIYIAKRPRKMQRIYSRLETVVYKAKKQLKENVIILIVSDHGMKPLPDGTGNHSTHGFWSININTEWEPKDFTDFFPQIVRWCNT
ncbi:MAG: alkaline phosphatase family protein [Candidatus Baldrarchaeia archaeon]